MVPQIVIKFVKFSAYARGSIPEKELRRTMSVPFFSLYEWLQHITMLSGYTGFLV